MAWSPPFSFNYPFDLLLRTYASCQHKIVKKRLAISLIFLLLLACQTAKPIPVPAGTVSVPADEGTYRFGTVYEGEVVAATFLVLNPSPFYLTIDEVESNCGCTTALLADENIPPDSQVLVKVTLNTARLWGPQSKYVTLYTNSPYRPRIKLRMEGVVRHRLKLEPRRIRARITGEEFQGEVRLINNTDEPLTLANLQSEPPNLLSVSLANGELPLVIEPHDSAVIQVEAELSRPGAKLVGTILLYLADHPDTVRIPVFLERENR